MNSLNEVDLATHCMSNVCKHAPDTQTIMKFICENVCLQKISEGQGEKHFLCTNIINSSVLDILHAYFTRYLLRQTILLFKAQICTNLVNHHTTMYSAMKNLQQKNYAHLTVIVKQQTSQRLHQDKLTAEVLHVGSPTPQVIQIYDNHNLYSSTPNFLQSNPRAEAPYQFYCCNPENRSEYKPRSWAPQSKPQVGSGPALSVPEFVCFGSLKKLQCWNILFVNTQCCGTIGLLYTVRLSCYHVQILTPKTAMSVSHAVAVCLKNYMLANT